jgi:HlyD family secretion protein
MRRFLVPALLILCAAGILFYLHGRANRDAELQIGVVRETEVHISTEINARLVSIPVKSGQKVHKGELIALLSSPELAASLDHAKASELRSRADRANVYSGVRKEEIDISTRAVAIAESNVALAHQQYDRTTALAEKDYVSKQKFFLLASSRPGVQPGP